MQFQYQNLAQQLAQRIFNGELSSGQRLNSLRQFALQQEVSLNTAKNCYELLEAQGLIYAKHKAGYFVSHKQQQHQALLLPEHPDFKPKTRQISNLELQIEIHQASINSQLIHLGAIQLSANLVPIDALRRSMQRAMKHSHPEDFLYSERQGHIRLREALSAHWAEDGFFIQKDDIFISNGCMPALSVLIQCLTQVGDSIIIPTPNFNGQLQLLAALKRKIVEVPASTEGIDLQRLEQAMRSSGAKVCLLTANYQNPLGFCLSNTDKEKIAQLAAELECFIIEDDIYAECSFATQRPLPIRYWDKQGYVLYCGSVSKSLSPSYRVGWFCLTSRLQHLRSALILRNVVVNSPLQLGLSDLIYSRAYRNFLNQLRPILMAQVQQYRTFIAQSFEGVELRLSCPSGGYALWLQFPKQIDGLEMYRFAQQQGINIVPGQVFGEDNRYHNCIRLNAGHELTDEIRQAIDCLADWTRTQLQTSS
ncbi:aminotransferase-like domain-containing protein [Acinetobacter rudis]|uniref:PLP-dependent aminotransferase family protein n=1 Tax=Acinetobacter rudis TaxID=632955 RepID=A0AAW8J506_9GAMM|nr:PLP-dependent aminotransferase family protein [Acinetobacter rudis]MDQ8934259.1 PLP-dependent aminotransferase family protein [Acinetobacter rudis]MDQ8952584.1 PLP-dependent aminotransferase family protein [Acinetobacter rudis]MDQ9016433.1 PLP-dependent aminotransferase family protein [Acinetobacter rudis]